MKEYIYLVRTEGNKVFYTFDPEIGENFSSMRLDPAPIMPYINTWPDLYEPQTVH